MGSALALKMVAYVGIVPIVGTYAHRLPRKSMLVTLDLARAALVACIPFVSEVWQIYPLIFLLNACPTVFTIPRLLADRLSARRLIKRNFLIDDGLFGVGIMGGAAARSTGRGPSQVSLGRSRDAASCSQSAVSQSSNCHYERLALMERLSPPAVAAPKWCPVILTGRPFLFRKQWPLQSAENHPGDLHISSRRFPN